MKMGAIAISLLLVFTLVLAIQLGPWWLALYIGAVVLIGVVAGLRRE